MPDDDQKPDPVVTSGELNSPDQSALNRRRRRDFAALLPILGILLFVTPFISTFSGGDQNLVGTAIYVFGIWAALIICAFVLARALAKETQPDREDN